MEITCEQCDMAKKYGFGRGRRITEDKEIRKVLQKGQNNPGTLLKIHYLSCEERRFAVRLERGIRGGYKRNRLRRRLREITRNLAPELKKGLYIVVGRKDAIEVGYNRLKEDFEKVVMEGNLWQK